MLKLNRNIRVGLSFVIAVVVFCAFYFQWFSGDIQSRKVAGEWLGLNWYSDAVQYVVLWTKYGLLSMLGYFAYRCLLPDNFLGRCIGSSKIGLLFLSVFVLYLTAFFFVDAELSTYLLISSFKASDIVHKVAFIIVLFLIVPVIEETCFRGILMGTVLNMDFIKIERVRVVLACVAPSLLFVALHSHYQQVFTFIQLFMFAIIVSIARLLSKGLVIPILLHSFAIFCGIGFIY